LDNYFKDYGLNPYEDPREDHLSTFSLDVDTASYSVARRYVMDGNLPPADDFVEHPPSLLYCFGSGRGNDKGLTSAESWLS
jgi:hypothetical protein